MKSYCKAYQLADLRRFPDWREPDGGAVPAGDTIVYLWDDLTVVANPVAAEDGVLWDTITEDWRRFCHEQLGFEIPKELGDD